MDDLRLECEFGTSASLQCICSSTAATRARCDPQAIAGYFKGHHVQLDVFGDKDELCAAEIEKRLRASGGAFQVREMGKECEAAGMNGGW
jgi:hypothetical protein